MQWEIGQRKFCITSFHPTLAPLTYPTKYTSGLPCFWHEGGHRGLSPTSHMANQRWPGLLRLAGSRRVRSQLCPSNTALRAPGLPRKVSAPQFTASGSVFMPGVDPYARPANWYPRATGDRSIVHAGAQCLGQSTLLTLRTRMKSSVPSTDGNTDRGRARYLCSESGRFPESSL
jgi:hypothetical protein